MAFIVILRVMFTLVVEMVCMCKFFPFARMSFYGGQANVETYRWNPEGVLLGVFAVDGGAANFAFVPGGMYVFNEHRLFKVTLQAEGREVKRDFGLY